MESPKKPKIVTQIEALWGGNFKLQLATKHPTRLDGLMAYKSNTPKYAVDDEGKLIGLNLAGTELDDSKWKKIELLLVRYGMQIKALNLNENKLTEFSLSSILSRVSILDIEENPLDSPTEEIMKQGKDAVLRFLRDLLEQGAKELFEVKMLIVGEGGTGKTTLWNLLQNPKHPVPDLDQISTIGIQIREGWTFKHLEWEKEEFLVNLWDFGGQDIQYMTHQFFLTRRSFYVLMADGRREVANFPYWLQIIDLLGCEQEKEKPLPVLVILNEKGNPIAKMPYDPETIKKDYPKLDIIKREVDFAIKDDGRIEVLTKTIQQILCQQIDHLPLVIPVFWNNVRKQLYRLRSSVNHIDDEEFSRICTEEGIPEKLQQDDLSQLLHDLGIILHFREDINLADFIILNPQWAVNAVYEIMKLEEVKTINQGRFNQALLQRVWTEKKYTLKEQRKLLNLMLKDNLEVCFRAKENREVIFIAPQLLPEIKPSGLKWEDTPETLRYIYHYPFMPKGIIGRLIVRLHEFIESSGSRKVVWEHGMIIKKDNCRAQVQFKDDKDQGRQIIKIEVQGKLPEDRKNVLRDIRGQLEIIHRRSFPALRVFQKVPCNCSECEQSTIPYEHDFNRLKANSLKHGIKAVSQCGKSFENVPVSKLLEGVFPTAETEEGGKGLRLYLGMDPQFQGDIREMKKGIIDVKEEVGFVKQGTIDIQYILEHQQKYLDTLLIYAKEHRSQLNTTFSLIDSVKDSNDDLLRVNAYLDKKLDKLFSQLPASVNVVQKWKETKNLAPDKLNSKWKIKFKLPLIFADLEKEISLDIDIKKGLNLIREEITSYSNGEKTLKQLFIEED